MSPSYQCTINYADKAEVKSKSRLSTPQKSSNENPRVAYTVEPTLGRKKTEVKGVLAEFQRRGMKIKNYTESNTRQ